MLFLTYWKLNENITIEERSRVTRSIMESDAFPPENVTIIRWDATPDGWGILVAEAESAGAIARTLNLWRMRSPGFFEMTKTAPAQPVPDALAGIAEMLERAQAVHPV